MHVDYDPTSFSPSPGADGGECGGRNLNWRPGEMGDLRPGTNHPGTARLHYWGISRVASAVAVRQPDLRQWKGCEPVPVPKTFLLQSDRQSPAAFSDVWLWE